MNDVGHTLLWIGMPGEDGEGAVELLDEHRTSQFVRIRERGKREFLRRGAATPQGLGKPLGIAARENNFGGAPRSRDSPSHFAN